MTKSSRLYDEVIAVTDDYLGPAAERFVARQITTHLHKSPEKLTRTDLRKLIDWIKLAISLLTDDVEAVDKYIDSLTRLAGRKGSHPTR